MAMDAAMIALTLAVAALIHPRGPGTISGGRLSAVAIAVGIAWVVSLAMRGCHDLRYLGAGAEEFRRVTGASFIVLSLVAIVSYLGHASFSRVFVAVAIPLGGTLLILGRFEMRAWLRRERRQGRAFHRVLVVGRPDAIVALTDILASKSEAGLKVIGQLDVPDDWASHSQSWLHQFDSFLAAQRVDVVAVAEGSGLRSDAIRELAWRLEGPHIDLLVAPSLADFAGPRLAFRPVAGLPLIHLDEPQIYGPRALIKRAIDLVGASTMLVVLSPLLLAIAGAIAVSSRGSVLFTQNRVGQHGKTFRFFKFRTMHDGAQLLRHEVIGTPDDGITARYRTDPRITKVGRVLRRLSLDELPQLLNVLDGSMSLVGPRPMLPEEVPMLIASDHRRHLIQPGLTGLWQVSGRKDLAWNERMRMDLWYVENWSPALDAVILLRTVKAVFSGHGAY